MWHLIRVLNWNLQTESIYGLNFMPNWYCLQLVGSCVNVWAALSEAPSSQNVVILLGLQHISGNISNRSRPHHNMYPSLHQPTSCVCSLMSIIWWGIYPWNRICGSRWCHQLCTHPTKLKLISAIYYKGSTVYILILKLMVQSQFTCFHVCTQPGRRKIIAALNCHTNFVYNEFLDTCL